MAQKPSVSGINWWNQPPEAIGGASIQAVNAVQQTTLGRQTRMLRHARLFGGYGYMSAGRFANSMAAGGPLGTGNRSGPRDNIIYAVTSTCVAELLDEGPPSVQFLTSHGDYELQEKAQKLEQFNDGLTYATGFNGEAARALLDAAVFGTGVTKHFTDADNNILCERVFPAEIHVDIWDGRDMRPRNMYQVGFIDRDLLATRYPDKRKEIMAVRPITPTTFANATPNNTNIIPYCESWHLPTSGEAGDGKHVLALSNDCTPVVEEWAENYFPFNILRFEILPTGFWGLGIAELLQGDQLALNDANRAEYWAWSQVAAPRIFAQAGSINRDHLNSSLSGIILEGTVPPQVLNWQGVHPDFVAWKNNIRAIAYNRIGVSQTVAGGDKPAGLNSGEAQRVYADQRKSRFAVLNQRWQEFYVEAARQNIRLAHRVYEKDKSFSVKVIGKGFIREVKFKDVRIDEDEFRMQALPISDLPKTVAGRTQTATELMQANLIDRDTGRKLLKLPDIDEAMDLANAAYDNARRTAYLMLHEGLPQQPDPLQNLQLCIQVVTAEVLKAMDNNAPPERIELCRQFLVQTHALMAPPPPPMPPPGAGPPGPPGMPPPDAGGPPMARGALPPVSPTLPFAQPRS